MAVVKHIQLPNNETVDVNDVRISGVDTVVTSGSNNVITSGGAYNALDTKQATLVSGTNIKTINNTSLLGSGNIAIDAGGTKKLTVVTDLENYTYDQYSHGYYYEVESAADFATFLGITTEQVAELFGLKYDLLDFTLIDNVGDSGTSVITPIYRANSMYEGASMEIIYSYTPEQDYNGFVPIRFFMSVDPSENYEDYAITIFDGGVGGTFQLKSNLVTSLNQYSTDFQYPSAKAVYTAIQAGGGGGGGGGDGTVTSVAMTVPTGLSVSGSPITTSGTLAVSLASGYEIPQSSAIVHKTGNETIAGNKTFTGTTQVEDVYNDTVSGFGWLIDCDSDSVQDALDAKQAALVSGTNIKTINSTTLLGSGDISVGTYSKPSGGIPATDLASAVQTSLGKADTALQSYTETDPVFSASAAAGISASDITAWNAKQKAITVSTSEPTSSDGSNGDIWIVI